MSVLTVRRAAALSLLGVLACSDEFAVDPVDGFTAMIETQSWPADAVLGQAVTLRVVITDSVTGEQVAPQDVDWTILPEGAAEITTETEDLVIIRPLGIGSVRITATLDDPAFAPASVTDSVLVHLAGITVAAHSDTLRSIGEGLTLRAFGLEADGDQVAVPGFIWSVNGAAIAPVGALTLDSLRVVAAAAGFGEVTLSHPLCVGSCSVTFPLVVEQAVASVELPATMTLRAIGATAPVVAQARDALGNVIVGAPVVLTQVDGAAAVTLAGSSVTAIAVGDARVAATLGSFADTMQVVVTQVPAILALSDDSVAFSSIGASAMLTVTVQDSLGTAIPGVTGITWESTVPTVVSVAADAPTTARIESEGNGSGFVRARLGALVAETHVSVTQVATTLIAVGGGGQSALVGTLLTDSLRVEARDGSGSPVSGVAVTWTVLTGGGSIGGTSVTGPDGRAAVAWTLGSLVGSQEVRASIPGADPVVFNATGQAGAPKTLTLTPSSALLTFVGDTAQLVAVVRDSLGNPLPASVVWSSTSDGVATVSTTGLVTAIGTGSVSIIAQAGALADTTTVTVTQHVASITLSPSGADTLSVGDTIRLVATARDSGGTVVPGAPITWSSTASLVAGVDGTGKVTATGRGATTIRAASNGALATFDVSVVGWALGFDGNDLMEIADAPAVDLDSSFTIEMWVRPRSTTGGALIAKWGASSSTQSYALYLRGLVPRMLIRDGNPATAVDSVTATIALVPDSWHHVAFVYDNGAATFYVNGIVAGAAIDVGRPIQTATPVRVGADALATPTFLTGDVDEIRIWKRARSAAEILAEQALRLPAASTGLAVYFPLYLGTGDPVDVVGGLVGVRGGALADTAAPGWITDGSPAP